MENLISEIQRLHLAPDEVLVVRPKWLMQPEERELLHRNLAEVCARVGIARDRIVVLDSDIQLTVVKADQMELV